MKKLKTFQTALQKWKNLNKIKNTSSINNYANELMGLKDGFDLVIAGSVIIKNSIGVVGVFVLFYLILYHFIY